MVTAKTTATAPAEMTMITTQGVGDEGDDGIGNAVQLP